MSVVVLFLLLACSCNAESEHELTMHTFEGHTPESYRWEFANASCVVGERSTDPGVWHYGKTDNAQECQDACAKNASCIAFDWCVGQRPKAKKSKCSRHHNCWFRADTKWDLGQGGSCLDYSGRKAQPTPAPTPPPPTPAPKPPLGYQPNIVFILTDDQDTRLGHSKDSYTELGSMEVMPKLNELLIKGGARMSNAFVATPICCPSRTEFFSGRYYHNIGPPNDPGGCMHVNTANAAKKATGVFGLMVSAGYEVGVFGKVTNDQKGILDLLSSEGSITWSNSPIDYNNYMGTPYYRDYGNGTTGTETIDKKHPVYGTAYQSTQIGNRTLEWLDILKAAGKILPTDDWDGSTDDTTRVHGSHGGKGGSKPFFAYVGPHAPHYPAIPAPWYEHAFDDATIPITPNYNTSHADKTQHIRQNPALSDRAHCWQNQHFRDRWASLLSVDDIVEAVFDKLAELKVLKSTYVFYSSDHGYKQGQWRVGTSKEHPFETDIRIPLLAFGPHIVPGSVFPHVTGNVDVTPTIIDLAGIFKPQFMDGFSMRPWLLKAQDGHEGADSVANTTAVATAAVATTGNWRTSWLVEYLSVGTYYNDHSSAWQDGRNTTDKCGGKMPRGPDDANTTKCVESNVTGAGNCYFVDSTLSNSWRSLRVIDGDVDIAYTEYDRTWEFNATSSGEGLQFYELYDLKTDPYQMKNVYSAQTADKKTALHVQLSTFWLCKGSVGTPSNCP